MKELELYKVWLAQSLEDYDLSEELAAINGNLDEVKDRFYKDLEFGTGGLRGVIGAGTNRMNIYTVRKATQGFADYINNNFSNPKVAIAYDSRIKSDLFAKEAAKVLAGNDIKVYLYKELMPTPCLSFAVRELECQAGIMVTASHNPAKYNGYKAYGSDGCQITLEVAEQVLNSISKVDLFHGVNIVDFDSAIKEGLIEYISEQVIENYIQNVLVQSINKDCAKNSDLKVVYTPLNGTGNKPVRSVLDIMGIKNVQIVKQQELPDGMFTTCPYPNPEIKETLRLGIEKCKQVGADLLLATDPDCDRVGIAVCDNNEYVLLTGNQVGTLLLDYICRERTHLGTMPKNPITVKTIVTTDIVDSIAKDFNVEVVNVLTGFKFIGEQISLLEQKGEQDRYIFGFEESYGYLAGTYVRDKDAVVASMLICEMMAYYKQKGFTLIQVLNNIYQRYGIQLNSQGNFTCEGVTGMEKMKKIMSDLRENPPKEIAGINVIEIADYSVSKIFNITDGTQQQIKLPKSDVIVYKLKNKCSVVIRPSGTEPKIKTYYSVVAKNKEFANELEKSISDSFTKILGF